MQAVNPLQHCPGVILPCEFLLTSFHDEQIVFSYFAQ